MKILGAKAKGPAVPGRIPPMKKGEQGLGACAQRKDFALRLRPKQRGLGVRGPGPGGERPEQPGTVASRLLSQRRLLWSLHPLQSPRGVAPIMTTHYVRAWGCRPSGARTPQVGLEPQALLNSVWVHR